MYQAIVLLPLLGAVVAGGIALWGAYQRHPGADPAPGAEDHASPPVLEDRPRAAPSPPGTSSVIRHSTTEPEQHAPPAEGSRAAEIITTGLLFVSWGLSLIAFYAVGFGHRTERVPLFTWFTSGDLKVDWSLRIDSLTVVMLVVVTTVSALVHLYSIGYMREDPYRPRFFAYLSFFTFAMLALVTSDNLAQLFFGWEGVGLASYLLIGFWYH
ncbi:MAG: NADH-quinone oxidoreductase subunit L, partial [Pseudomonadota bacterium]|nr:NADH-quinone oxidoreductase subunit L [Pseudomonadota bacterium]